MSKRAIGWLYVPNVILQIPLTIAFLLCLGTYQDYARDIAVAESTGDVGSNCILNGQLMTCKASAQLNMDVVKNFMIIIGALMVIGGLLAMIAWINTLINLSRRQQWAWFILTFFFGGIMLFIYLIGGPEVPQKQSPVAQVLAFPQYTNSPEIPLPPPPPQVYQPQPSALEVLQLRFARGEIDTATFHQMSEQLRSSERR